MPILPQVDGDLSQFTGFFGGKSASKREELLFLLLACGLASEVAFNRLFDDGREPFLAATGRELLCMHVHGAGLLRWHDIRAGEILASEKQRHTGDRRECIRHTVTEIQSGGVTATPEPDEGCDGSV